MYLGGASFLGKQLHWPQGTQKQAQLFASKYGSFHQEDPQNEIPQNQPFLQIPFLLFVRLFERNSQK